MFLLIFSIIISSLLMYCIFKWDIFSTFFSSKIDPKEKRHGGELVASVLKAHDVKYVFTLIGGHISPIIVAAEKLGIKIIDTRHEVTTVFAADAYSRLSGRIGVAAVTAGPGITNTVTAVKNAQMAQTPLLLIGGAAASLLKGRGALQDIDQLSLMKSVCKHTKSISCLRHIVPELRKAIQIALSGTPGPVFIELPIDVLYPYDLVKKEMKIQDNPKGFIPRLTNLFLKSYLHYLFASAFEPRDLTPLPVIYPTASNKEIQKCHELLSQSKRPLILFGSQAMIPAIHAEDLSKAINQLNIPCYLGGMSRGLLGKDSPLHMRQKRQEAIKEADLIILAGTVCDFRLSYGRNFRKSSKIISINMDKEQLKKNSDLFWTPTACFKANASDFLIRLSKKEAQYSFDDKWIPSLRERDESVENKNREKAVQTDSTYLNPVHLMHKLDKVLPDNTILVADGGDFVATASYILKARGPLMWLDPGAFGTLGVGAGFAIGAKLCNPDAQVVILYGDGSCGYSIIEYDTFVRFKMPIISIVGNDACWTQIAREQVPLFQSAAACNLAYTDYEKVVEALGGVGFRANAETDLENLFANAISMSKSGKPVLVNAIIGKTDFRAGSISI